jgi:sulfopyruvate decarboxylase TPP-binding subunit
MDYYHDNNIGWVARPPHNHEGFIRTGKFKKASNMNFALDISNKTEDKLLEMINARPDMDTLTVAKEEELYQEALEAVLQEDQKALAGGNIRMGEIILIVDSDTRVVRQITVYVGKP